MMGYAVSIYMSKEEGDKVIEAISKLEKALERKVKNSEFFKNGAGIYSEALEIFLENKEKFSDLEDFNSWLISVIADLKKKVKEVPAEQFKLMRGEK
jgi:hypothetical protein